VAWQLPFLLYARDKQDVKGFEEIAVRFCNVKDAARAGNHCKLWMRNVQCTTTGHGDLEGPASANGFPQSIYRHC